MTDERGEAVSLNATSAAAVFIGPVGATPVITGSGVAWIDANGVTEARGPIGHVVDPSKLEDTE